MRLWLVIDLLKPYGAQRVALDLARAFLQLGVDVNVITYSGPGDAWPVQDVAVTHVGPIPRGPAGLVVAASRVRRLVDRDQPSVMLSFMEHANTVAALATVGRPVLLVMSQHTISSEALRAKGRRGRCERHLYRASYKAADAIVAVSEAVARDLSESLGVPRDRVRVIYNPVDAEAIRSRASEPVGHPWFADAGKTVLVAVGALKPAKGHWVAIEALLELPPQFYLMIVGDGPLHSELEELAQNLGLSARVDFTGWNANPLPYVKAGQVVVLPSVVEGFGLVALEAAALGKPLAATDAGGLAEVTSKLGLRAASVGDAHDLASLVRSLVGGPPSRVYPWVAELSPDRVAQQYLQVIKEASGAGPRSWTVATDGGDS